MTTLLIDADGVAFKAAAAVQKVIRWDDDILTTHADLNEAIDAFEGLLATYVRAAEDESAEIILCYSCPSRHYFRHDLLPTYKGNRKDAPPLALRPLKEWSATKYVTKTKPNLEADDVLGILATHKSLVKGTKIIVTIDKDLQQIPGLHLNTDDVAAGVFRVSPDFGRRVLWRQVLTGDTVDNYSGCPGIGPKRVGAILDGMTEDNFAERLLAAYEKAGLSRAELETQFNVARILTASTYNFKTKEPILWQM